MKSNCKGLEVFDFNEHGDETELIAAKVSTKLNSSHADDKYRFLQNVAQGTDIQLKESSNLLCVDVDTINSDHKVDCTASIASLVGEECVGKNTSTFEAVLQVGPNLAEQLSQFGSNKLEPLVVQGTNHQLKEIVNIPFVDVDTINSEHNVDCSASIASLEGDVCAVKSPSSLDAVLQIGSNLAEQNPHSRPTKLVLGSSFARMEDSSRPEAASPGSNNFNYPPVESSSSDESFDAVPDADESMIERSGSTSSDIGEEDVPIEGPSSDICFGNCQMGDGDSVVCFPDYIVYRDKYCTDSMVSFSRSCIEIKGSTAYGDHGTPFTFQWGIDDIISIESRWCGRFELATVKIHIISRGLISVEDSHGSSGIEELKFAVVDCNWCEKQAAVASLDVYKPLWNIVLDSDVEKDGETLLGRNGVLLPKRYFTTFDESSEDVIYPKRDPDAVSVSKRDFDLLLPDTFINDTIIDFYIKYLKNKFLADEKSHKFHFFNSFFFRKLADLDKNPSSAFDGRAAFQRVRKWTRKINLFEKDYVFIPVNFNYHWSLIVICYPGEVAEFKDADVGNSVKVPCILHMDSIRGSHSGLKDLLQSYLWEEWKERRTDTSDDIISRFLNLRFLSLELPQQQNSSDCGLFLLHYVELFLERVPISFNPFKLTKFSKFLTADWFQPSEAFLKRAHIQRLISDLLENSHEISPDVGSDKHCTSKCPKPCENGTSVELLPGRCSPSKDFHVNVLSSQAEQGFEMTLFPTTSQKSFQCARDSGSTLREFFEPGVSVGSCYQAVGQTASFDDFKMAMSLEEGEQEAGRHFGYSPSEETEVVQQLSGTTPEACEYPHYSSTDLRAEPSWNPESTLLHHAAAATAHEEAGLSPEMQICTSNDLMEVDDSRIEINLSLEAKIDHQASKQQTTDAKP